MKMLRETLSFLTKTAVLGLLFLIAPCVLWAQNSVPCQPPEVDVAAYDFVPETKLQTGDFRPLMKTETAFLEKLRELENISVSDYTTPILSADIQPEPPTIYGELQPPPNQLPEPYFFVGQITKTGSGFLLTVDLKKSADSSLLDEVKTPFPDAVNAETAGNTTAAAMIAFFASQAQAARDNRETSDHAIDPHIDLIIDKLQLKPNEVSPVKIILTDCDGVRLKHRTIEAFLQLTHDSKPVEETTLVRVTDDKGERNGDIGAKAPGVITYIAKFKYKDTMGVPRERTDTKTIVVSGGETAHLWQMRADVSTENYSLYFSTEKQSGTWSGRRYLIRKKASFVFVFKANDSDPSGDISTDEVKSYNGYGEVYRREKSITANEIVEVRVGSGLLDQSTEAAERLNAGFSISPGDGEFQVTLNNIAFVGTDELYAARKYPYNYVHKTGLDFREGMGVDGGTPVTSQMRKSGVYTFSKFERKLIDNPENSELRKGGTKGYEITKYDFEVRRLGTTGSGLIKK